MFDEPINILTRTSKRPKFFSFCKASIDNQTYQNTKQIISIDNAESESYVKNLNYIKVTPKKINPPIPPDVGPAPHNLYLNALNDQVKDGWIMYLDDDDCLQRNDALEIITQHITSKQDLIFWRVNFLKCLKPEDEYWQKEPQYHHISMCGFMYHSNYKQHAIFDGLSWADFKVVQALWKTIPNKVWINEVLTGVQLGRGKGLQQDRK